MNRETLPSHDSAWSAAHGGIRGSTSLAAGALVLAAGALLNLGGQLAVGPDAALSPAVTITAWLAWILGLAVCGWGLVWIAAGPVLGRSGWAPGLAHLVNAAALLVLLFVPDALGTPPWPFAAVRLQLLAVFAWREAPPLGRGTATLLGTTALAASLKILARTMGFLPDPGVPLGPLLDGLLNVAVAVAMFQAALRVRAAEARWAEAALAAPTAGFEQFDNPDHAGLARR